MKTSFLLMLIIASFNCIQLVQCMDSVATSSVDALAGLNKQLRHVSASGDFARVKQLIAQGAYKDAQNNSKETPLHLAAKYGHTEVVKYLIKVGANKEARTGNHTTPLLYAAHNGHAGVMKVLIDAGADIEAQVKGGKYTSFHRAANYNRIEAVKLLIRRKADIEAENNVKGTPLHMAATEGHIEVVKLLIDAGANKEARDIYQLTPLLSASNNGQTEVLKLLINKSANKEARDNRGQTVLHHAVRGSKKVIVQFLFDKNVDIDAQDNQKFTPLHHIVLRPHAQKINLGAQREIEERRLQIADLLINKKANLNAQAGNGETPLHIAVLHLQTAFIKLLLKNKANINIQNDDMKAVLEYAQSRADFPSLSDDEKEKSKKIIKILQLHSKNLDKQFFKAVKQGNLQEVKRHVQEGMNINRRDNLGSTVLNWAAECGNLEMIHFLIEKKAAMNVNNSGHTPLHHAARSGSVGVVRILLNNGGEKWISQQDIHRKTPLKIAQERKHSNEMINLLTPSKTILHAARFGRLWDVKRLFNAGHQINLADGDLRTGLHWAVMDGHTEVVKYLLNHGVDLERKNIGNATALYYAVRDNPPRTAAHKNIIKLLIEHGADTSKNAYGGQTFDKIDHKKNFIALYPMLSPAKNIHEAARDGQLWEVKRFLDIKINIESTWQQNYTPLLWAVQGGHQKIVEYLLKKRANINARNGGKFTPLNLALFGNKFEIAELLINNGANVDIPNHKNEGPLHHAVTREHLPSVQRLVSRGAKLDVKTVAGCTPLHLASSRGYIDIVKYLIEHGAKIDEKTPNGTTELYAAARQGRKIVVQFLLEKGANIELKNKAGKTALDIAREKKYTEIIKLLESAQRTFHLRSDEDVNKEFYIAAKNGNIAQLKQLYKQGVDINFQHQNMSALRWACLNGHENVVKLLIEYKVNHTGSNSYGLLSAAYKGHCQIVDLLLSAGFNKNIQDTSGNTPLIEAAGGGHIKTVIRLIKEGLFVDQKNKAGYTPLYRAVRDGKSVAVVKLLIEADADLDISDYNDYKTPLHIAARDGHIQMAKLLIEAGADINLQTKNKGYTALDIARMNSDMQIVKFLENARKIPKTTATSSTTTQNKKPSAPSQSFSDLIIKYSDITLGDKIGSGGFGQVFKAKWNYHDVAVKILHMKNMSDESEAEFKQETEIWQRLHFPSIVALFGICVPSSPKLFQLSLPIPYCMVMAYKKYGSLYSVLKSKQELPWSDRRQFAIDIASALQHLHKKNIMHRDLKSMNVLVSKQDDKLCASLTDFGLSKVKRETVTLRTHNKHQVAGTLLWMAPEILCGKRDSKQADIYAYGMILWELATRKIPFYEVNPKAIRGLIINSELGALEIPVKTPSVFVTLIKECWNKAPEFRPTIETILEKLNTSSELLNTADLDTLAGSSSSLPVSSTKTFETGPTTAVLSTQGDLFSRLNT